MNSDAEIRTLIGRTAPGSQELSIHVSAAGWDQAVTGNESAARRLAEATTRWRAYHSDPAAFRELRRLREEGGALDPVLRRQMEALYQSYLTNQIGPDEIRETVDLETEIRQIFNNFRAKYQGRYVSDNELGEILRTERDSGRRHEAWVASKQIGSHVADKVRTLVRLRNESARKLGYRDYFAMRLDGQELDEARLFETLDGLLAASDAAYRAEKAALDAEVAERLGLQPDELMPWHYENPFFQSAPKGQGGPDVDGYFAERDIARVSVDFYDVMGLEVRDILARSDLYERPGKNQHAFCTNIDRAGDVRILCNLQNNQRWMTTQLHELGHAVYEKYTDPGLPWLLRSKAHTMTTEAIAQLMGRLTNNALWLNAFAGVPESEARSAEAYVRRQERRTQLIFARWGMVMTHFERALYADPDQDLGAVWWDLVTRFQHLRRPEGDRSEDWAAKIHVACYPVYYHNYVLGELTASQLQARLVQDLGEGWMLTDAAGAWLWQRIFRPGNLLPWHERLAKATGEALNPRYFVEQFAGTE